MSTSTGAPAAFARSLGQNDITNGAAAATAPTPPTTLRRADQEAALLRSTVASDHASTPVPVSASARTPNVGARRESPPVRGNAQNRVDYTGFAASRRKPGAACAWNPDRNQRLQARTPRRVRRADRRTRPTGPALRSAASVYNAVRVLEASPCCANSGSFSRRPARCASPRCSSSRRCGPISLPRMQRPRRQRRAVTQETVDAGDRRRRSRATPTPRRRRCRRSSTSTRARRCARAIPLADDPLLRRYFPDLAERLPRQRRRAWAPA